MWDSINKNQQEDNYKDLHSEQAIEKIKEMVEKSKSFFFCTSVNSSSSYTRPMSVQDVDDEGNLWFLSADDGHKNLEFWLIH